MTEKFGTYRFNLLQRGLAFIIRAGIVRGKLRKLVRKFWRSSFDRDSLFDITYQGLRLRIMPRNNNTEEAFVLHKGIDDEAEIKAILSFMPENGVFVDIGANVGYYSLMVASQYSQARIVSYEPNPSVFARLVTNIKLNDFSNITAIESAIGDKEGTVQLQVYAKNEGASSIKITRSKGEYKKIKMLPLKDGLEKLGINKIHALKIDVEGFEDKALLPYFKTCDKTYHPDLIVIEHLNPNAWDKNVIDYLLAIGYDEQVRTISNLILQKAR